MPRNSLAIHSLALLLAVFFAGGCLVITRHQNNAPAAPVACVPVAPATPLPAADLQARYQAALAITSFTERDIALGRVAQLAANSDDATIARSALSSMTSFTARDDASDAVAITLAARGHRQEAIAIAQSMTSFTHRDATLAKLSTR